MSSKDKPDPRPSTELPRTFTYAQVAEMFHVSERRIRGWVEAGKIGFLPLPGGRGRVITEEQIREVIVANSVDPEVV